MWTGESHWSAAFIISVVFLVILLAICVAAFIFGLYLGKHSDGRYFTIGASVSAVIILILYGIFWFPFHGEYHQYQKIQGTVETVNKRLVSSGESSMEEKLVVTYDSGIQVGCLDTRCASLKAGDTLTMNCIRRYEWFSTSGYDCRFVSID